MNSCIQCGTEVNTKFCPNCGQKQNIPRLRFKTFFEDFFSRIYGLDGAMPRTIIGLSKNPGKVIREYVQGIRGKYVGPVGYYFLLFAAYTLLFQLFDINVDEWAGTEEIQEAIQKGTGQEVTKEVTPRQMTIRKAAFNHLEFLLVLSLPFIGLWALVFYKKSGYNLLENIVFGFYTQAHALFFNMAGLCFFFVTGTSIKWITSLAGITYFGIATSQYFKRKVTVGLVLKSILLYIVAFITFFIFVMLIGVVIGLLYPKVEG